MTIYARIENNIVMELYEVPEGTSINDCFHPSIIDQFVDVTNTKPMLPQHNWSAQQDEKTKNWLFLAPLEMPIPEPKKSVEDRLVELEERLSILEGMVVP